MIGYMNKGYVESFAEFGVPLQMINSGGWLLRREVPGFNCYDGMGCYPYFVCRDWRQLRTDLEMLRGELLCVSLVTDPFAEFDLGYMQDCFSDLFIPFKEHFIIELGHPLRSFVSSLHCRKAQKGLLSVSVEKCDDPTGCVDEWVDLYGNLIKRHNIKGIRAFSRNAFVKQLSVPGTVVFKALHGGDTVGALLWYVHGEVAHCHLAAFSDLGYELLSSFALFWTAIEYFSEKGLKRLAIGSGAGMKCDGTDGLSQFKRGWATGHSTVYLCGCIFNQKKYLEISQAAGASGNDYFPIYRKGEFEN